MADDDNNGRDTAVEQGDVVKAFEQMRTEFEKMRRAFERQPAAAKASPSGDLLPTLGTIMESMGTLANSRLLGVSYNDVAQQVARGAEQAKREGLDSINASKKALDQAASELRDLTDNVRSARFQNWSLGLAGLIGAMLWGFFGGVVLRAMPDSWGWPEKYTTLILDMTRLEAGLHLAAGGFPGGWAGMSAGRQIVAVNPQAITACQKAAEKAGKAVPCALKVPAPENLENAS